MNIIKKLTFNSQYKTEIIFFLKLFFLNVLFYCFNYFWTGLCVPGNIYSNFADTFLDYHDWLIDTLRIGVNLIAKTIGYNTYFPSSNKISVVNGHGVGIANACSGAGVMFVWIAFILSFPSSTKKKKIRWLLSGLFAIWFINVIRILALLIAVNQGKKVDINQFGEHHDLFNYVAYGLIIIMIFFYTKSPKSSTTKNLV